MVLLILSPVRPPYALGEYEYSNEQKKRKG